MKTHAHLFFVSILLAISTEAITQPGNLVVFAPKGEKFTLFIGNSMQNNEPASRVEAANPGGPSFKIKVVFPDPSVKEISKVVFNKPHDMMFFKVGKNSKGNYVLESTTSEWREELNEQGRDDAPPPRPDEPYPGMKESNPADTVKTGSGKSTWTGGCENPMSDPDFTAQLIDISARPFEPMQLSAAKKMAEKNCLLVSQVILVIHVFDLESSRLGFAKYAFDHTYDRQNYDDVKEALHSEKSKEDLDKFISGKKK